MTEPTPEQIDAFEREVLALITEHGLQVTYVFDPEGENPPFGYSTGLTGRDHPEFVVFGLDQKVTHWVINHLGQQVVEGSRTFQHGDRLTGLLQGGYEFELVKVAFPENHLSIARRIYGGDLLQALQIVWQDKDHRWPWDEGAAHGDSQPVVGEPLGQEIA